jgi:hypothetical protein
MLRKRIAYVYCILMGSDIKMFFSRRCSMPVVCQFSPRDFRRYSPSRDRARSDAIDITGSSVIGSLFSISRYVDLLYPSTLERPKCVCNATTSTVTTTVCLLCFVENCKQYVRTFHCVSG